MNNQEEGYVILIEKDNDIYDIIINTEIEEHVDSINSKNFDNKGIIHYFLNNNYRSSRNFNLRNNDSKPVYNLLTSFFDKNNICVFSYKLNDKNTSDVQKYEIQCLMNISYIKNVNDGLLLISSYLILYEESSKENIEYILKILKDISSKTGLPIYIKSTDMKNKTVFIDNKFMLENDLKIGDEYVDNYLVFRNNDGGNHSKTMRKKSKKTGKNKIMSG